MAEKQLDVADQVTTTEQDERLNTVRKDQNTLSDYREMTSNLLFAVEENDEDKALELIEAGANVNLSSFVLYSTGPDGKEFAVQGLLDKEGKTALYFAVENNNETLVRALIDAGADVNIIDRETKSSVLIQALKIKNKNIIDAIIKAGADVKTSDTNGRSALTYALENSLEDTAQKLIDAGANVNITDDRGKTALFYAYSCKEILTSLIEAADDVNQQDNKGTTALFYAVQYGNEFLTRVLIAAGADVNLTDIDGKTALFYGAAHENILRILVEEGKADVNARDYLGRTPLFYAIARSTKSASYLHDKGNSLQVKDHYNKCIFSFAYEDGINIQQLINLENYKIISLGFREYGENMRIFGPLLKSLDFTLIHKFFIDNGAQRSDLFNAIINTVFCKILSIPGKFIKCRFTISFVTELPHLSKVLELAKHKRNKGVGGKNAIIENILVSMRSEFRDNEELYKTIASKILPQLIQLGADPNSTDSYGNTALHYATRLLLHGASKETVMTICTQLKEYGALFNITNHQSETPLLFCLSREIWTDSGEAEEWIGFRTLVEVCLFLLENKAWVDVTTKRGESVFHLILILVQQVLKYECLAISNMFMNDAMVILTLFSQANITKDVVIVNKRDLHLNSPLHLWATLRFQFNDEQVYKYVEESSIENVLKIIFNQLLKFGVKLNDRNKNDETPLHLCRTWAAVKLLIDAGAKPNDIDSSGRTPLLTAAKSRTFMRNTKRFYPDVSQEPKEFWRTVFEKGLDSWTVDINGESVLSILVESGCFALAKGMLEAAREKGYLESDNVAISLLNAVCKDKSTRRRDKALLVKIILKSRKSPFPFIRNEDSALHLCCRNIIETSKDLFGKDIKDTALWEIAELLIWYGADCAEIPDATGKTCLDIAEECPALKEFLISPINIRKVPFLIHRWNSVSSKYEYILTKVATGREYIYVKPFWYHRDHLASGSFGAVFAGINEIDGREVAVKRIEKIRMHRPEDKREIANLTVLADCEQVVRYLSFFEDGQFSYVVLELMEGNVDDYLDGPYFDENRGIELCQNVMNGLRYLHSQNILHRDLKPTNILYKLHPKLCLKIADFGLSRRIDSTGSTTVYESNVGTRCWIAPEVLKATKVHSNSSDVFACGLVLHYILSVKKHPFAPADCAKKGIMQINHETEAHILNGHMEGWDNSLCPEAAHLIKQMLDSNDSKRPSAEKALDHPFFWAKKKKLDFLLAVGNQPEFEFARAGRFTVLTAVESDLEANFATIVKRIGITQDWNNPGYVHMPVIYTEMTRRRAYDTHSVVELVRFIRNAYAHVSDGTRPIPIKKLLLEDFVFLEYFPYLVMEVYKAVTTHGWDQTRDEIQHKMNN